MATFTKLGLALSKETIEWKINDEIIKVKKYLPIEEKMELCQRIINASIDDGGYYNDARIDMNTFVEVLFAYTDIKFTDKQKENYAAIYDKFMANDLYLPFIQLIDSEYTYITGYVYNIIRHMYDYRNSVYGILDVISTDYSNLKLNADEITKDLQNPEQLTLLKNVMNKLG